ncbi:MAG TPA: prolyl oligopeptidase family serine peptidase [Candidatus Dormibacteraeota bacterium]|nr:prolyl oligopeptidase family serine peptidase [Candidatus Dormibacteraeota bacterium]
MKRLRHGFLCFIFLSFTCALLAAQTDGAGIVYPKTKTADQVDDYHGVKVADPYRWLEDTDSADTHDWVEAENKLTFSYLEKIPYRGAIRERLTKLWNYERFTVPQQQGGRYFYQHNDGLQNQNVLLVGESLNAEPRMLLDPNTLSADGTVALSGEAVTDDGKLMAYGTAASGSDWTEWHVRDVDTGKDLPDVIKWVKFSGASWTKDGKGFYYSRYDEPKGTALRDTNYFQKLFYHKLGTEQAEDKLIYERPDNKELGFGGSVTNDGHYLVIFVWQGTSPKNRLYYKDLTKPDSEVVKLLDDFDAEYRFIDNDGPVFWIRTDLDAPRGRLIAIDTRHPEKTNWKTVVAQGADKLEEASVVDNLFLLGYLKDAKTEVRVHDLNGKFLRNVDLPGIGTASGFGGKRKDKETFYSFTSFISPTTIYRYEPSSGKSSVFKQPKVDFDATKYETRQVFYNSKDGTRIPMFLTYKKGLKLDGQNPTLLYAYGGFDISLTPAFSVPNAVWLEMGGVYAQPNLRGGGEYGEDWHLAGTKAKKQNVFDDFIAAAEWLIANKYTSTPKLAIRGGSNGGLLIGACLIQRPDLYGATLPLVGVMDMLRFQKFTIGWAWTSDYGSSDNADDFKALYAYSPLHNLKAGTKYPPTMISTADHDDRVVPGHSFKFAATMQADQAAPAPVLIRIETKAGHGAGKPISKTIEEMADEWSFVAHNLGMNVTLQ